jgi:hypothetical protein
MLRPTSCVTLKRTGGFDNPDHPARPKPGSELCRVAGRGYPAAAAGAGRTTPPPATLRARLPGASGLRCSPHPSMIDSH